ncbi:MAG: DNA gyrase subunit B, partial [Planctomycetales bacterium]|nr:DNA gyrase subunit B [Planctomycetales bacterium]
MYELVQKGHVYVACPPLFRVQVGKGAKMETYYVQTDQEMRRQLMDKGLAGASFHTGEEVIEGERMQQLTKILADMEDALLDLERRGISLKIHAERSDENGDLPRFHVFVGQSDYWFHTKQQYDAFLKEQAAAGKKLRLAGEDDDVEETDDSGTPFTEVVIMELLEVRSINQGLRELRLFGFDIQALIPQERTGIQEARYEMIRGETRTALEDLRGLAPAIRDAGEKILHVTRFKGLGEMNAEELRETTLDPANRTLMKVTMNDAGAADEMFRVLMGD